MIATSGTASAHAARPSIIPTGTVSINPSKGLIDGQTITIHASGFNPAAGTMLYAVECDPHAVAQQDESWCDVKVADAATPVAATAGAGTLTFKILTGSAFKPTHKGAACDFAANSHQCIIVVTDAKVPTASTIGGFANATFKDTRVASKTTLKGKKTAKANSKVTFTATTKGKGAKPTGKVLFKDNGKKVGSVKEKASGKVTEKIKIKAGKNKITATYSGDANFKTSTGKATVTGKK